MTHRQICLRCLRPSVSCYCEQISAVTAPVLFVFLIHPLENRRPANTGRMAWLSLPGSQLIDGHDFSNDDRVNQLIASPANQCFVLYPGEEAVNIDESPNIAETLTGGPKQTVIFVIDGTWSTSRKTMRLSDNLQALPRLCFQPQTPSEFAIRQQPHAWCYSTIEAVHHVLTRLCPAEQLENFLTPFTWMVETQLPQFVKYND